MFYVLYSAIVSRTTFPSAYSSAFLYWLFSSVRAASLLSSYVLLLLFSDPELLITKRFPPVIESTTLVDSDDFGFDFVFTSVSFPCGVGGGVFGGAFGGAFGALGF